MVTRVTKQYDYNVECPVCGFNYKASELKTRWDGLQVCPDDWEPRHPLDFYKPRNDTHKLPFILPAKGELSYTPTYVNRTDAANNGAITDTAYYRLDSLSGYTHIRAQITVTVDATTATASATISLPTTAGGAGNVTVFDTDGVYLGTGTITAGGTTANLPNWTARNKTLTIQGRYVT